MKALFSISSLFLGMCGLAFGQLNIPPCAPNQGTNCTDYFGAPNYANSPLPAGSITGFNVVLSGSGYANPVVTVSAPELPTTTGSQATAGTPVVTAGAITSVPAGTIGDGYIMPQVTVVDVGLDGSLSAPTCGDAPAYTTPCGSGALVTAIIGPPFVGGIRKFQDTLPDLKSALATADTKTFPGSDYYEIALVQNTWKFHTDLPATTLRGYVQLNLNGPSTGCPSVPPALTYLGPSIVATKNRPVRVKFINCLPTGLGGNLFIPTDTTYMGAGVTKTPGVNYTQNRATLHLHGGASPWISDGTPYQWTVPPGETGGPARGDSVQMVPDMWFDKTNGAIIPSCAGQTTCTGATNDPGPGALTFYWTNQQGARLMFYHDHAVGITRLNVYAGEAAGYVLSDPVEETALAAATAPGTIGDLGHLIPLVIQDKSFVPSQAQLAIQDPTWAGNFGTTAPSATGSNGDLWFPHVYVPNQNPSDPGGSNAFGRWDYGPWFTPAAQTVLSAANPAGAVTTPCTSVAFLNAAVNCPITPNPSGTPEGFMDTSVVNGKAYPVLHVSPAAYRFKILSVGNDRSLALQLYVADSTVTTPDNRTNTEVKMLPAVTPAQGSPLPLCTQLTPITNTGLGTGLATAILDGSGNPINGTGLPANCWPNYGAPAGIPIQQTMWGADGRIGGVPDPTKAGPPFIQIGTEGGLLPAAVVIPSIPTNYEFNVRSVTVTNVGVHGLWLGPAERADVIVDFSKYGGKTLILYNDAPGPAPAMDSRYDYFTGDGDQTPIGGAPNTLPGYGPNTRTIMQIVVDGACAPTSFPGMCTPNATPFSLPALTAALPGVFAQTQAPIIVPEPAYPPATGGYSPTWTYDVLHSANFTYYPIGSTTPKVVVEERKTIQELFTPDYGRMNATLGVELPLTNFLTQTTIPLGYIDPPTEIIRQGDTQFWKITHNGVDTHFIHFHLFNVQVINRMGWDGTVRPIDQNELGWKDTVRMNPLEDILVALQPITPIVPFPLRDSYRLMDVTMPAGSNCPTLSAGSFSPQPCSSFTNVNPLTNNPVQTNNAVNNFGWEYVWHCHILGHEENDMMRAISFQVPPETPSSLVAAPAATGLTLTWTDNSASETGFTLQRDTVPGFTTIPAQTFTILASAPDANGQGITFGGTLTFNDVKATGAGPYYYRVQAYKPDASYWTPTGTNITSGWSNTTSFGGQTANVSPAALAFGNLPINTAGTPTSTPQTLTLSNTGSQPLTITSITVSSSDFTASADPLLTTCGSTLAGNSSCLISVTFTPGPTSNGSRSATLTIANNSANAPTLTVPLTGTYGLPLLTITAGNATMKYGSKVAPVITASFNPPNPTGLTTTCTAAVTSTSPVGTYQTSCTAAGAGVANYTIAYVSGTVSVTPVPLSVWASNATMVVQTTVPTITPSYVGFVAGDSATSLSTAPTCTTTATITSNVGTYPSTCSGTVDPNYTITYINGTVTVVKGLLTITAPSPAMNYGSPVPALTPTYSTPNPIGLIKSPICTTTATATSPVGTYPVTCTGAVSTPADWTFAYVAGTLTINQAPLTVTAPSPTMTYGGALPTLTPIYSGFAAGDTAAKLATQPTCTTTATATPASPVGAYPVTCSGGAATNYTFTYAGGTLSINTKAASVTPNAATKVYGTVDPVFTGTLTGFLAADNVTATYSRTTGETVVGSYTISATLSSTLANPTAVLNNYTITYGTAAFTITRAALTITADNATRPYNTSNPAFTVSYAGFVTGETSASLTTQPTCTTTAIATSPTGTYPITCVGALDSNYTIGYVAGRLTVTPVAPQVTLTGAPASAANQSNFPVTATTTGVNMPTITGTTGVCSVGNVTGTPSAATATVTMTAGSGTCVLTANWAATTNYQAATASQSTTATLIAPTVTFTGAPASANYKATFTVIAGTNGGVVPTITATDSTCLVSAVTGTSTNARATVTMNSGTGTCALTATWPAAANYLAATATRSTAAAKIAPTVTFTAPASAAYNATFNVATTTNSSIVAVIASSGACSNAGNVVTMTSGTGTCSLTATWPADSNYSTVTLIRTTNATKAASVTTITSNTPNPSYLRQSVTVGVQVSGTGSNAPTGTVIVTGNGGITCTASLTTLGAGSCSLAFTTGGAKTLTGTYVPATDPYFAASTSAGVSQTVYAPTAATSPGTVNFGAVNVAGTVTGPATVTITNNGSGVLTISSMSIAGANSGDFSIGTTDCITTPPGNGMSCSINLTFKPTAIGARAATLTLTDNAANSPQSIALRGTGR